MSSPKSVAEILIPHISPASQDRLEAVRAAAKSFETAIRRCEGNADPRMLALTRTHFELAQMYALHAVVTVGAVKQPPVQP